jgi:hypothetical protein
MNETEKKFKREADWFAAHSMTKQEVEKLIAEKMARALAYLEAQNKQSMVPKEIQ